VNIQYIYIENINIKKIIRLTESDLVRMVKRVIKEQSASVENTQDKQQKLISDFINWCKGKGKVKFEQLKDQEDALNLLIDNFEDDTKFIDDGTLSDNLTIKSILAQIK